jgi:hypothetical protein
VAAAVGIAGKHAAQREVQFGTQDHVFLDDRDDAVERVVGQRLAAAGERRQQAGEQEDGQGEQSDHGRSRQVAGVTPPQ